MLQCTKKLNIQVDNLCQFLPQDRVCAFAQLSQPELLQETEKAVGGEGMLEEHMKLIELKKAQMGSGKSVEVYNLHSPYSQARNKSRSWKSSSKRIRIWRLTWLDSESAS